MAYQIICEDFELSDGVREATEGELNSLAKFLAPSHHIKVFLRKIGKKEFGVYMQVHVMGKTIVGSARDLNFHKALHLSKEHLLRQLKETSNQAVSRRRRA